MTERMTEQRLKRIRATFAQNLCLGTDDGREVLAELDRARARRSLRGREKIAVSANGHNGNGPPAPFPAVTEPIIIEAKKRRARKPKPALKHFEIHAHGGRIGGFDAADEADAQRQFAEIVPVKYRRECEIREVRK